MSVSIWLAILLTVTLAAGFAAVLRRASVAGAWVLGGLLAGLVLGPAMLGRIAPVSWERVFAGGVEERGQFEAARSERDAWRLAVGMTAAGETAEAAGALHDDAGRQGAVRDAERAWRSAIERHRAPLRVVTLALAVLVVLHAPRRERESPVAPWPTSVSVGLWSAGVPIAGALLLLWLRDESLSSPGAAAALAAVSVGSWTLVPGDRDAALAIGSDGPSLMRRAASTATVLAAAPLIVMVLQVGRDPGSNAGINAGGGPGGGGLPEPLLISLVISATVIGALRRAAGPRSGERSVDSTVVVAGMGRRSPVTERLLLPALAALASLQVEWIAHTSAWLVLGCLLLSGDGRWLGAWVGTLLSGRSGSGPARRLALAACGSGPLQVAIAAMALTEGVLDQAWAGALLLGALSTEVAAPLRRWFAVLSAAIEEESRP